VIGGSSFGGLAAAFTGLSLPDVFGGVLSQSGAFQWRRDDDAEPAWLPRNLSTVASASIGTLFSMRVGILEAFDVRIINESVSLLDGNRMMRDALRDRRADMQNAEYSAVTTTSAGNRRSPSS
jgi:iron(III)-enterobactin esterase